MLLLWFVTLHFASAAAVPSWFLLSYYTGTGSICNGTNCNSELVARCRSAWLSAVTDTHDLNEVCTIAINLQTHGFAVNTL